MSIRGTQQGRSLRTDTRKTGELQKRAEGTCSVVELIAANPKDGKRDCGANYRAAEPGTQGTRILAPWTDSIKLILPS